MGRACRVKATGAALEYQDHARVGTLIGNAESAGHAAIDVEEYETTLAAYLASLPAPPPPTDAEISQQLDRQKGIMAVALALGQAPGLDLTPAQIKARVLAAYKAL